MPVHSSVLAVQLILWSSHTEPRNTPANCDAEISRLTKKGEYVRVAGLSEECWEIAGDRRYLYIAAQAWRFAQYPALALYRIDQYLAESIKAKKSRGARLDATVFHKEMDAATVPVSLVLDPKPADSLSGEVVFRSETTVGPPIRVQVTPGPASAHLVDIRLDAGDWNLVLSLDDGTTIHHQVSIALGMPRAIVVLRREARQENLQRQPVDTPLAVAWEPSGVCGPSPDKACALARGQDASFPVNFRLSADRPLQQGFGLRIRSRDGSIAHQMHLTDATFDLPLKSGVWSLEAEAPNFEPAWARFAVANNGETGGTVTIHMRPYRELRARRGLTIAYSLLALPAVVSGLTLSVINGRRVQFPFDADDLQDGQRVYSGMAILGCGLGLSIVGATGLLRKPRPAWWAEFGTGGALLSIGLPLLLVAGGDLDRHYDNMPDLRQSYRQVLGGGALAGTGLAMLTSAAVALVIDTVATRVRLRAASQRRD